MSTWATSGTVTLLFTDIEGSTRRWGDDPAAMRALLEQHDDILHQVIAAHDGHVFKTIGDAFCAVFPSAPQAVLAAMEGQAALMELTTHLETPLRVRMALHSGEVEQRDDDFFGPPVNHVARLLSAAHGGQTLLSQATYNLVLEQVLPHLSYLDLGPHKLRDLPYVERIYQVSRSGASSLFPPIRSVEFAMGNLPPYPTAFIGRREEMRHAGDLLRTTRLLTMTGIGGTGKTRLALQLADLVARQYNDGAWMVDLAPITDGALVAQTVAVTLGISLEGHRQALPEIMAFIRNKHILLLLDNCEHLVNACAQLAAALLNASVGITILATSREALHIPGETVYRVPPLSCPPAGDNALTPDALLQYEAVRLFLDRAQAVAPAFTVTEDNTAVVAQLCVHLDGLPLAIELATARLRVLTVEQIVARLDDRFRLLTGGARTALPRQQTLRALIDWSYDLLAPSEQALLRRLAVFAGGWTLEAAEDVCADDTVEQWEILDLLAGLVEKSLALADPADAGMRYRMLEVVRQYGEEKLREAGEVEAFRARHVSHFLDQVAREKREIASAASPQVWARWAAYNVAEMDNFRAALQQGSVGLDGFPLALTFFRRFPHECRQWLDVLLARNPAEQSPERAEALLWAAHVCRTHEDARPYVEESLRIYQALGQPAGVCECLRTLSRHAVGRADLARAKELSDECRRVADESGDQDAAVHACITAAVIALAEGKPTDARPCLEQALVIRQQMRMPQEVAFILMHLGTAELLDGNLDRAQLHAEESHRLFEQAGNPSYTPPLRLLGDIARARGHWTEALACYRESIADHWRQADSHTTIQLLERFGYVDAALGNPAGALRWLAAADCLREQDGYPRTPVESREWERELAAVCAALGDDFQTAWEDGQATLNSDVLGEVLTEMD